MCETQFFLLEPLLSKFGRNMGRQILWELKPIWISVCFPLQMRAYFDLPHPISSPKEAFLEVEWMNRSADIDYWCLTFLTTIPRPKLQRIHG
mmetsp:Transcript_7462/g.10497  ORF Transcript_7462/g.10497 Transcript_7462/m.10497 type:complete len:92 (-) Transcript_7462:59-334(-)